MYSLSPCMRNTTNIFIEWQIVGVDHESIVKEPSDCGVIVILADTMINFALKGYKRWDTSQMRKFMGGFERRKREQEVEYARIFGDGLVVKEYIVLLRQWRQSRHFIIFRSTRATTKARSFACEKFNSTC